MRVKIFTSNYIGILEQEINEWLRTHENNKIEGFRMTSCNGDCGRLDILIFYK